MITTVPIVHVDEVEEPELFDIQIPKEEEPDAHGTEAGHRLRRRNVIELQERVGSTARLQCDEETQWNSYLHSPIGFERE